MIRDTEILGHEGLMVDAWESSWATDCANVLWSVVAVTAVLKNISKYWPECHTEEGTGILSPLNCLNSYNRVYNTITKYSIIKCIMNLMILIHQYVLQNWGALMHTWGLCTHPQDKFCMKPCWHIDISFRFSTQRQASIAILFGLAGPVVYWHVYKVPNI